MFSKRLIRQLKKAFGSEEVGIVSTYSGGDLEGRMNQFCTQVDESYAQLDERNFTTQRNMQLSSDELTEANQRLFSMNSTFDAMLNSLGEGFFMVDSEGVCQTIYSRACETLLETSPAGKKLSDVLKIKSEKHDSFNDWLSILFQDLMDFEKFSLLGPKFFNHSQKRIVGLDYKPIRNRDGQIERILIIATDHTAEVEATRRAEMMQEQALLITNIVKHKERFSQFVTDFRSSIPQCEDLLKQEQVQKGVFAVTQTLHGLKGASGTFGMLSLQKKIHEVETHLVALESWESKAEYLFKALNEIQIEFERTIDQCHEILGDFSKVNGPYREIALNALHDFAKVLLFDEKDKSEIHDHFVSAFIALPCTEIFSRYELVVQQVARKLNKKVNKLNFKGENPLLVPEYYGRLWMELEHVFRNIVDHGIEGEEARRKSGKDINSTIQVEFAIENEELVMSISDDGKGIDSTAVRKALKERGLIELSESNDEQKIIESVFLPGFSTAEKVSEISGRGVGLSSLYKVVQDLGGRVLVHSVKNAGTQFKVIVPMILDSRSLVNM